MPKGFTVKGKKFGLKGKQVVPVEIVKHKKKRGTAHPKQMTIDGALGLPPKAHLKLKYLDRVGMGTLTASNTYDIQFRLNSIYDPLYTGSGVYPGCYNLFAGMYTHYRVMSIKYRIEYPNIAGEDVFIFAIPNASFTSYNSATDQGSMLASEPRSKWLFSTGSSQGHRDDKFTGRIRLGDLTGQTRQEYIADDGNASAFGTNPSNPCQMHCAFIPIGSGFSGGYVIVALEFDVEFFGLKSEIV